MDPCEARETVLFHLARSEDVHDAGSPNEEGVREKAAMASPRDRLRAHDGRPDVGGAAEEAGQGRLESLRLHVIRVPAESGVPPAGVP